MGDIETPDDAPLTLKAPRKLELMKSVGSGQVRQSFSRGRTKPVAVEVMKRRTIARGAATAAPARAKTAPPEPTPAPQAAPPAPDPAPADQETIDRPRVVLKALTENEKMARARALDDARSRDEDVRRRVAEQARRQREEEARLAKEREEADQRKELEEARKREEEAARKKAEETAARKLTDPASEERREPPRHGRRELPRRPVVPRRTPGGARRSARKITLTQALNEDERVRSLASVRRQRERERRLAQGTAPKKVIRDVVIPETISVQEFANRMAERAVDVVSALMRMGEMTGIDAIIDADTAEVAAAEFGHRVRRVSDADVEIGLGSDEDPPETLLPRSPVVTVMGHVDHGKTSLLDALRQTDVVSGEAGGITQHIGAYQVELASGKRITFIDTPGHEAFTAMRARGATVTDLVVLVVAADDGVMPQTIEAIRHAREAGVPMIVAVNKIDVPGADPRKVREALLQHEVVVEEMGGDVLTVDVSAKEKIGLDKLEDMILLQAELLELKSNPDRPAQGVVIEARIDTGRGPMATLLVARGTLRRGEVFVAGGEFGRVRVLMNDRGQKLDAAGPAVPVEILGLNGAPKAGDQFQVVESEARAREIIAYRRRGDRPAASEEPEESTMEAIFAGIKGGRVGEFPVVVKADVQGSVEAVAGAAKKLSNDEVQVRIVHSAAGGINESDVSLAKTAGAVIVAFNVRANTQVRQLAQRDKVDIRYYSVIYDVIEEFKGVLTGMLAPTVKERTVGAAEILEVFNVSKVGKIAGCRVLDGTMRRGARVRLLRDSAVIHEGALGNLKRFKDDVGEVKAGMECGMSLEKYQDVQVGDQIEAYEVEEIARSL